MKTSPVVIFSLILITQLALRSTISAQENQKSQVQSFKVLILSTMLAERGIGEWGFSALVEADGHQILFDTGKYPDTVLKNARELDVDLSNVTDVVLSHQHGDHIGGLLKLRQELSDKNDDAISRVHIAKGFFEIRRSRSDTARTRSRLQMKAEFEQLGGVFIEHETPTELLPGVWLTGPVVRLHPEKNWGSKSQIKTLMGWEEDNIPESQSLIANTNQGLVVLSGCGHAGIVNTMEYARNTILDSPVYAVLGGFHLLSASDEHLKWTATKFRELGVQHFLGAHCTGIEAVYQIRLQAGLLRKNCVVGAVGASFNLSSGIDPLRLAR